MYPNLSTNQQPSNDIEQQILPNPMNPSPDSQPNNSQQVAAQSQEYQQSSPQKQANRDFQVIYELNQAAPAATNTRHAAANHDSRNEENNPMKTYESVRLQFVKKVMCIVVIQFLITVGMTIPMVASQAYRDFYLNEFYIFWIALSVNIVTGSAIICYRKIARKVPINYILLFFFTLSMSYMLSGLAESVNPIVILCCFVATFTIVFLLSFYVALTNKFLSSKIIIVILLLSLLGITIYIGVSHNPFIIETVIGSLFIVLFTIILYSKIQSIYYGTSWLYTLDDYVIAAVDVYLDIVQIYLLFLCIGRRR